MMRSQYVSVRSSLAFEPAGRSRRVAVLGIECRGLIPPAGYSCRPRAEIAAVRPVRKKAIRTITRMIRRFRQEPSHREVPCDHHPGGHAERMKMGCCHRPPRNKAVYGALISKPSHGGLHEVILRGAAGAQW
jgi:hypothetical protein